MNGSVSRNFHLPLSDEAYKALRSEAQRRRRPATAIARDVLEQGLKVLREEALHSEIAVYAANHAGTIADLDLELEGAGIETIASRPAVSRRGRKARKRQ